MDNYFLIKYEKFRHIELPLWIMKSWEGRVNKKRTSWWDVLFKKYVWKLIRLPCWPQLWSACFSS